MTDLWKDGEFTAVKRCPRCQKLSLTQGDHSIKCTNCGYSMEIPHT